MKIDRLIGGPFFDTEKFETYLKVHKSRLKPFDDHRDGPDYTYFKASLALIDLIGTNLKVYIPLIYLKYINENIEEFEANLLCQLYMNYDLGDVGEFLKEYSTPKKIQTLISEANPKEKAALIEYQLDRDMIKLIEKYYNKD